MATREDNPFKPQLLAYGLEVTTMDTQNGGTNADLTFKLKGCRGTSTVAYNAGMVTGLYSIGRMKSGQADWVTIPSLNLGKLTSLEIVNDGTGLGGAPGWDLGDLSVGSARWIEPRFLRDKAYTATFNTTIPGGANAPIDLTPNFTLPLPTIECPAPITVDNAPGKCNAVVMLTIYDDDDRIFEALCAGASGYLLKKTPPARLLELLREAVAGGAPRRRPVSGFSSTRQYELRADAARNTTASTVRRRAQLQDGGRGTRRHRSHHQLSPPQHLRKAAGPLQIRGGRESAAQSAGLNSRDS